MLLFAALAALGAALLVIGGPATETTQARDRDGDGIPDRWERRHGLSTTKKSGRRDLDGDRLRNRREFRLHLNPRRRDSDGDHLGDRAELTRWNTNPRKRDTDGDGLRDRREVKKLKTKPRRRDTDRDGLGDGREVKRLRTNPRKRDTDGDGFSDRREIRAGTNPRDKRSHPRRRRRAAPPASPPPAPGGFPTPSNTGVPAGWTPKQVRSSNMTVTTPNAVIQDIQFDNADLILHAPNITVRNVKFRGGSVYTDHTCDNGHVIENTTFEPEPGRAYGQHQLPAIYWGGYTARRVKIWRRGEGFTVGAKSSGCTPVRIEDSFAKISIYDCNAMDWHSDGIQGYDGNALTVRNLTIDFNEASCGTAPFFYPHSQGNIRADVDRLLVMGGGYSFRMGTPGTVRNLKIVNQSWSYGPIDVKCSALSAWDASLVTITSNYQIARTVRSQPCNTEAGG
jgi:hypothetical protein